MSSYKAAQANKKARAEKERKKRSTKQKVRAGLKRIDNYTDIDLEDMPRRPKASKR